MSLKFQNYFTRQRLQFDTSIFKILHEYSYNIEFFYTSWGKEIKCEACRTCYLFFATSLINSIIQEHEF